MGNEGMGFVSKRLSLLVVAIILCSFGLLGLRSMMENVTVLQSSGFEINDENHVRYIPPLVIDHLYQYFLDEMDQGNTNWDKFAYVQYATNIDYTCNALMNFERLRRFDVRAELVLLTSSHNLEMLPRQMREEILNLGVLVKKISILKFEGDESTWEEGYTKFHIFQMHEYDKIIYFDSDSTVLSNMDELFFIPDADLAIPLAYGETLHRMKNIVRDYSSSVETDYNSKPVCQVKTKLETEYIERSVISNILVDSFERKKIDGFNTLEYGDIAYKRLPYILPNSFINGYYYTDYFMVVKPNQAVFDSLIEMSKGKESSEYDMDLINKKFSPKNCLTAVGEDIPKVLILPHNVYGALSGLFRWQDYHALMIDPNDFECLAYKTAKEEEIQKQNDLRREKLRMMEEEHGNYIEKEQESIKPSTEKKSKEAWGNLKFIHYSDWPIPKPWVQQDLNADYIQHKIVCRAGKDGDFGEFKPRTISDCYATGHWNGLYEVFMEERKRICGLLGKDERQTTSE